MIWGQLRLLQAPNLLEPLDGFGMAAGRLESYRQVIECRHPLLVGCGKPSRLSGQRAHEKLNGFLVPAESLKRDGKPVRRAQRRLMIGAEFNG